MTLRDTDTLQGVTNEEQPVVCDSCEREEYGVSLDSDWSFPRSRERGPVLCPDCVESGE